MKALLRTFGIIAILISLLFGALSIHRALDDKKDADQAATQLADARKQIDGLKDMAKSMTGESKTQIDAQIAEAETKLDKIPSPSTYIVIAILLAALVVLSVVFGVLLFKPNLGMATKLLAASVVLLLAAYFISPDIERGPYGGMATPTLALMAGIPVIIVGLLAFFVAKKSLTKENS